MEKIPFQVCEIFGIVDDTYWLCSQHVGDVKVQSHCCDLSCNVVASCGRSGIACSWPGVVLRSHKLAVGLL